MFSGKSEELIRRLRRAQIARQQGPDLQADDRQPLRRRPHHLAQRDAHRVRERRHRRASCSSACGRTPKSSASTRGSSSTPELPAVCNTLADQGKRVIVAGLDQDYLGKPFEPMPQLLAIAEYITKTLAICMVCGAPANHTQRLVASSERVLVGAQGTYEARCRALFRSAPRLAKSRCTAESAHTSSRSSCAPRSSALPVKWMSCVAILSRSSRRAAP